MDINLFRINYHNFMLFNYVYTIVIWCNVVLRLVRGIFRCFNWRPSGIWETARSSTRKGCAFFSAPNRKFLSSSSSFKMVRQEKWKTLKTNCPLEELTPKSVGKVSTKRRQINVIKMWANDVLAKSDFKFCFRFKVGTARQRAAKAAASASARAFILATWQAAARRLNNFITSKGHLKCSVCVWQFLRFRFVTYLNFESRIFV